jgi:hypothetical protein
MKTTLTFKSLPAIFRKERNGKKPNTLRRGDLSDQRFSILDDWIKAKEYGLVRIENAVNKQSFVREVTDVTYYEGWYIISWKHKEEPR